MVEKCEDKNEQEPKKKTRNLRYKIMFPANPSITLSTLLNPQHFREVFHM